MKHLKIGTKALSTIIIFLISFIILIIRGGVSVSYLRDLNLYLITFISSLSMFGAVFFIHFWNLKTKSRNRLLITIGTDYVHPEDFLLFKIGELKVSIGPNHFWDSFEIHPLIKLLIILLSFIFISVSTFNNREFNLILNFPKHLSLFSGKYCPDLIKEAEKLNEETSEKMGCKLIIRAYKLGYAKSLGECSPKTKDPKDLKICTLRRENEPLIHYMGRQLYEFLEMSVVSLSLDNILKTKKVFEHQVDNLDVLSKYQKHAIAGDSRSRHIVFTNLKYPGTWFKKHMEMYFDPSGCIKKYQGQDNKIIVGEDDLHFKGKYLEHISGHLLFNPRIKISVGQCREYSIVWNTSKNACKELADNPKSFLKEHKILRPVQLILDRHANREDIKLVSKKISEIRKIKKDEEDEKKDKDKEKKKKKKRSNISQISRALSFQCFMEDEIESVKFDEFKFKLGYHPFRAQLVTIPTLTKDAKRKVELYKNIAKLLEKSFYYESYNSKASLSVQEVSPAFIAKFDQKKYSLTKLDLLNDYDIFLENDWVFNKEGLYDVYPFHIHLGNFVKEFRVKYKINRGRL